MRRAEFSSARYQHGASPFVTLLFVAMAAFFVTIGFKLAPPFYDYWQIKGVIDSFQEPSSAVDLSVHGIEGNLDKRLITNNIRDFNRPENISVAIQEGILYIDLAYENRVKIFANVDAVITFKHSIEVPVGK